MHVTSTHQGVDVGFVRLRRHRVAQEDHAVEFTDRIRAGSLIQFGDNTVFTATLSNVDGVAQEYIVSDWARDGDALVFTRSVPSLLHGGDYQVQLSSEALINWTGFASIYITPQKVTFAAPASANAGDTITVLAANAGGVDSGFTGTLKLVDPLGSLIASLPVSLTLGVGVTQAIPFDLPSQVASSPFYGLQFSGLNHLGEAVSDVKPLAIAGLAVTLSTRPPAVRIFPPFDDVPAWKMCTPGILAASSSPWISRPFRNSPG